MFWDSILHVKEKEKFVFALEFKRDNWDKMVKFTKGRAKNLTTERSPDGRSFFSI